MLKTFSLGPIGVSRRLCIKDCLISASN